jgi:DNA-binding MarR family transcriptional regulator
MRIEDEIKQERFSSEFHKLVVNLKFTANWLNASHLKVLRKSGLSVQQFNVLRILRGQHPKPASLNLIRERMLDKESNASRLIDKLEFSGYISRIQCPKDRRQIDITITQKGLDILGNISPEIEELTKREILLSEDEARTINILLDKMRG